MVAFASYNPNNPDPNQRDFSNASVELMSPKLAKINLQLFNTFSFGGVFLTYDDSSTSSNVESINFLQEFPHGIALGLQSSNLEEVFLTLTDNAGKQDSVILSGLHSIMSRWHVDLNLFDEIDVSKITTAAVVVKGRHPNAEFQLDWGEFLFNQEISGVPFDLNTLTQLNKPGIVSAVGSSTSGAVGLVSLNQYDSTSFDFVYDLRPSDNSFVFSTINAGGFFSSEGIFQGESLNLPADFILSAQGAENSKVKVEIVDVHGEKLVYVLNLRAIDQNYILDLRSPLIDRTQIAAVNFIVDRNLVNGFLNGLVSLKIFGLNYQPPILPAEFLKIKENLIEKGISFFIEGKGLDPNTFFPYDSIEKNGLPIEEAKHTQPTSIGFYLQILGDIVSGKIENNLSKDEALNAALKVVNSLLSAQSQFGWKGLIPWIDLRGETMQPLTATIGLGDNANLAQSLAVMMGALEGSSLSSEQRILAEAIVEKSEEFLDNQEPGYVAFVDPTGGIFRQAFIRNTLTSETGSFDNFMDHLGNEFRGAVAFLAVRYELVPDSVWDSLAVNYSQYFTANGTAIENLAFFDGGGFQAFWPGLRNRERDFIGFRNALDNAFVTFTDYSSQNHLPGFVSASQNPNVQPSGEYHGRIGIRQMAEPLSAFSNHFIEDVASTYSLASAYSTNQLVVLNWLSEIAKQLPSLISETGFFDAARSSSEIAERALAIDVASTVLGLAGNGPADFEQYLRNRNLELDYNSLYDEVSKKISVNKTFFLPSAPPEFANESKAVFNQFIQEGEIGSFPVTQTTPSGVRFTYSRLNGGFGGKFWVLDEPYDVQSNQLVITYNASDSPQSLKLEMKDENDTSVLAPITFDLPAAESDKQIVINLPNVANLAKAKKVFVVVDQNSTQDFSGNFLLRSINFRHLPSSQSLIPKDDLGASDVTHLPGNPKIQFFDTDASTSSHVTVIGGRTQFNFNIANAGEVAGITVNFDSQSNGSSLNLESLGKVIFGLQSASAHRIKIEVDDENDKRAEFYAEELSSGTKQYYEFLTALVAQSINTRAIKKINFVVESSLVNQAEGSFVLDLDGVSI